mgnify:CR=1 FL=1
MKFEKMENDLFYNIRHLKTFQESSGSVDTVWSYRWPDGGDIEVYNRLTDKTMFKLGHDPQLAEYICSLHNMSCRLMKEVESKYVS